MAGRSAQRGTARQPRRAANPTPHQAARCADPYAQWAVLTDFRAFRSGPGACGPAGTGNTPDWPEALDLVAELCAPASAQGLDWLPAFQQQVLADSGLTLSVPAAYRRAWAGGSGPRFVTLRLHLGTMTSPGIGANTGPGTGPHAGPGPGPTAHAARTVGWSAPLARALDALTAHPAIVRLQLGHTRPMGDGPAPGQGRSSPAGAARLAPVPDRGTGRPLAQPGGGLGDETAGDGLSAQPGLRVVLGVIEDECPWAHPLLRPSSGGVRLLSIWDQSPSPLPPSGPWSAPADFDHGRWLGPTAMGTLAARHTGPDGHLDATRLYADAALGWPGLQRRGSHGAAVLGLLARGSADLAPPGGPPLPLLAVRLPTALTPLTAGRWLASCALDGVHHLLAQAQRLDATAGVGLPLVLNLSYGAAAGAHDGTDLLSAALDELQQAHPRLAVVVAAGNTHGTVHRGGPGQHLARWPSGLHAGPATLPAHGALRFALDVPAGKAAETTLELWFTHAQRPQHLAEGAVEVSLWPPGSARPWLRVRSGGQAVHRSAAGAVVCPEHRHAAPPTAGVGAQSPRDAAATAPVVAGLLFPRRVSQSRSRSMALVMLAGTALGQGAPVVPAGVWEVQVRWVGRPERAATPRSAAGGAAIAQGPAEQADLGALQPGLWQVEAWVERDDHICGAGRRQGARLVAGPDVPGGLARQPSGPPDGWLVPPSDHNTLGGLALSRHTASAGALVDRRDASGRRPASPYSASGALPAGGSGRGTGPTASAVADQSPALPGIRVAGHGPGHVLRANGTSMAAPQLAAHLARAMAAGATREQALAALRAWPGVDARRGADIS